MSPGHAKRSFAQRTGAATSDIASSPVATSSHPDVVANLIGAAATSVAASQ